MRMSGNALRAKSLQALPRFVWALAVALYWQGSLYLRSTGLSLLAACCHVQLDFFILSFTNLMSWEIIPVLFMQLDKKVILS